MDFIPEKESMTVKELINLLLDENMNDEIIITKDGKRLRNICIAVQKKEQPKALGALFG